MSRLQKENEQEPQNDRDEYLTDEEIEAILAAESKADKVDEEASEMETGAGRKWISRTVALVLALALVGNILAFWPQVYSLAALEFLRTSRELSQNEDVQTYREAVVVIRAGNSKGTGFNISPDGLIVTNAHVVGDVEQMVVNFADGRHVRAEQIAADAELDLALLKTVEGDDWPTLKLDPNRTASAGDSFYVIGNPLFFNRIANEGEVLGQVRPSGRVHPVWALQAPIYRGNSGSPIIDKEGYAVAIVYATMRTQVDGRTQNVGLAIPVSDLMTVFSAYAR